MAYNGKNVLLWNFLGCGGQNLDNIDFFLIFPIIVIWMTFLLTSLVYLSDWLQISVAVCLHSGWLWLSPNHCHFQLIKISFQGFELDTFYPFKNFLPVWLLTCRAVWNITPTGDLLHPLYREWWNTCNCAAESSAWVQFGTGDNIWSDKHLHHQCLMCMLEKEEIISSVSFFIIYFIWSEEKIKSV